MFEFLFKYPIAVFAKGDFVLLGGWPKWILWPLALGAVVVLGWRIQSHLGRPSHKLKYWQAVVIWLLESTFVCLILILLWRPAIVIAELKPQQNVIAVLVDDSRSMGISDGGPTREEQAKKALSGGLLGQLQSKFQTRLYRLDSRLTRLSSLQDLAEAFATTEVKAFSARTVKALRVPGGALANVPLRNVLRTPRRTLLTLLGIAAAWRR